MDHRHKVGGYVKLAKLWERSKDAAVAYHSSYSGSPEEHCSGLQAGQGHKE